MSVRLPFEMKEWIKRQAVRNGASQNSEILRCIRVQMDAEQFNKATS